MSYSFYRTITVTANTALAGSTTLTNFPVEVAGTYAYLATIANGGKVQNASGFDIAFYSDSGLTSILKWDMERYTATTGAVVFHVRVPSFVAGSVIYMAYGNAAISTFQGDVAGTYDSFESAVYHLGDISTTNGATVTANALNVSGINSPTGVAGQVYGAAHLVAASTQYFDRGAADALLRATTLCSFSCWYKPTNFTDYAMLMAIGTGSDRNFSLYADITTGAPVFNFTQGSGVFRGVTSSTGLSAGVWHLISATYDGTTQRIFLNGVAKGTNAVSGSPDSPPVNSHFCIGALGSNTLGVNNPANGDIDEVRVSQGVARTADWWLAQYNNQFDPSTFYAVGAETGATIYTMTAETGSFSLTGNDATLRATCRMTAGTGTFTLTGNDVVIGRIITMSADVGTFMLTGNDAALRGAFRLTAETGVFTLTGFAISEVLTVPPKHYTVRNYAQPFYRIVDTTEPTYTASVSISPQYTITEIKQDE